MEALILSGMPAAGKTTTAIEIAKSLKMETIGGGDILKEMAKERGYVITGEGWWDTPEGMKFLEERKKNADFDKEADRRMIAKIDKGNIVVTSYTMPWLSRNGIKIWLEADFEVRAERMSKRDGMPLPKARKVVKERDEKNYSLYKKMYGIELGKDLKPFKIVLDVNNKTPEEAAKEIIMEAEKLESRMM